jgi:SAV_6107-like HEPN
VVPDPRPDSGLCPNPGGHPPSPPRSDGGRRRSCPVVRAELQRARSAVLEAELAERPSDRYLAAHRAALRVAAVILAARANPARPGRPSRPRNAWEVLAEVAPEFGEWAAFFAATQPKRDAVQAGATTIITTREADDMVLDANAFLSLVERACA